MTRKSKKYQLLVITLLLCILQVAGIDVYAQSTVTPMKPVPADIVNRLYKIL